MALTPGVQRRRPDGSLEPLNPATIAALPVASPNAQDPDPAYAAGSKVRKLITAPTAYDAMGQSYMAQSQAATQTAAPVRSFARGLSGAEPQPPAAVRPQIRFAGTDAAPDSMFKRPLSAAPVPRTAAQLDAASAAEVAARNKASPASSSPGVGAPAGTGGGSASGYFIGSNGVRRNINADGTIAGADPNAVTVNRQSFGGPTTLTRGQPAAGTTSQLVPVSRSPGTLQLNPAGNAETMNARADREAREKLASDLDSQRFRLEMIAGNPGRRGRAAIDALGQNAQQRAALAAGAERLSSEAIQNRAQRENVLVNTGLEQQGLDRRTEQDIMLRRDALAADQSGVSQVLNGENGTMSLLRRDGSVEAIQNPDGTPFRSPALDRGQPTAADRLTFLRERMAGLEKSIADARFQSPTADVSGFQSQLDALQKQAQSLLEGQKPPTAAQVASLKANPDKAADFDALFGPGAAARILGTK